MKTAIWTILFFAAAIRLIAAHVYSLHLDEVTNLRMAQLPLGSITQTVLADSHLPLFYYFTHFWMEIIPSSRLAWRLPSVIFSVIALWRISKLSNHFLSAPAQIFCLVTLCLHFVHLEISILARPYALAFLLSVLSYEFWLNKNVRGHLLVSLLGLCTHNIFLFVILSQFIYDFHNRQLRSHWLYLVGGWIGSVFIGFSWHLPKYQIMTSDSSLYQKNIWQILKLNRLLIPEEWLISQIQFPMGMGLVALLIFGFNRSINKVPFFICILYLMALLSMNQLGVPTFILRYHVFVLPFFVIALAYAWKGYFRFALVAVVLLNLHYLPARMIGIFQPWQDVRALLTKQQVPIQDVYVYPRYWAIMLLEEDDAVQKPWRGYDPTDAPIPPLKPEKLHSIMVNREQNPKSQDLITALSEFRILTSSQTNGAIEIQEWLPKKQF